MSRVVRAVVTAERAGGSLTRDGLEEDVPDGVILLDHRVANQIATRRLRIVKYRGSRHGTDEHPFHIGGHGMSVLPITSLGLTRDALDERVSTRVSRLGRRLRGEGDHRGSRVLITGSAGTRKTTIGAHRADTAPLIRTPGDDRAEA